MITVVDDFIPEEEFLVLYKTIMSPNFWWHWNTSHMHNELADNLQNLESTKFEVDYPQMIHRVFYAQSINVPETFKILKPILDRIKHKELLKIKCNLNIRINYPEHMHGFFHQDVPSDVQQLNAWTGIYYVNDSDGDTLIIQDDNITKSIPPKANRFVYFPSHMLHAGNCPRNYDRRVVVNFNWIPA